VYAVRSSNRQLLWSYNTQQNHQSYPGLQLSLDADGTLYVPVDEKLLLALAPNTAPTATAPTATAPTATPTITAALSPTITRTPTPTSPAATPIPTSTSIPGGALGGNLMVNGGFENDVDNDSKPDGWQVSSTNVLPLVSRNATQHAEGSYSLRASSAGGESFSVYRDVEPVSPGQRYNFSGMMNVPSNTGSFRASVLVVALNQWGGTVSTFTAGSWTSTTGGWVPASTALTVPNGATTLRVTLKLDYLKAVVHADAFSLTPAP
jgi:hypothetical protein